MSELIEIGKIAINVTRKDIKNVHLSVHPPDGRVTLSAPTDTRLEVVRAYAISKLAWIREQQDKLGNQARETPREFVDRESHFLWGRRYLMTVIEQNTKPYVDIDHKRINLSIRPCSSKKKRAIVIHSLFYFQLVQIYEMKSKYSMGVRYSITPRWIRFHNQIIK